MREDLVLRGWEKLPYAVVERPHNGVRFVDARTFEALSLCDGQIDLSLPIISDEVRAFVEKLEEQGAVRRCEPGERLTPDQEYRRYQNRFVRTAHWSITGKCNYRCRHCYMSAPDAKLGEIDHDTMMDLARADSEATMHVHHVQSKLLQHVSHAAVHRYVRLLAMKHGALLSRLHAHDLIGVDAP